ncbi:hypothetical protein RB213_005006 [Colletotrichum asianum]
MKERGHQILKFEPLLLGPAIPSDTFLGETSIIFSLDPPPSSSFFCFPLSTFSSASIQALLVGLSSIPVLARAAPLTALLGVGLSGLGPLMILFGRAASSSSSSSFSFSSTAAFSSSSLPLPPGRLLITAMEFLAPLIDAPRGFRLAFWLWLRPSDSVGLSGSETEEPALRVLIWLFIRRNCATVDCSPITAKSRCWKEPRFGELFAEEALLLSTMDGHEVLGMTLSVRLSLGFAGWRESMRSRIGLLAMPRRLYRPGVGEPCLASLGSSGLGIGRRVGECEPRLSSESLAVERRAGDVPLFVKPPLALPIASASRFGDP